VKIDWPGLRTQIVSGILAQIIGSLAAALMMGRSANTSVSLGVFLIVVVLAFVILILAIPFIATLLVELVPSYPRVTLAVLSSENLRGPIVLELGEITFGRKPECGVFATGDRYMSGRHAKLRRMPGRVIITDMDSKNRTFVNEQPLSPLKEVVLENGDVIRMGNTAFRLVEDCGTPILNAIRAAAASLL
jgi:hypothetical protein